MKRLVWIFGWVAVALWSLLCAGVYGLVDLVGWLVSRNVDMMASDPRTVEGLWRFFDGVRHLSTGAVVVGWAIVSLLILSVPWVFDRLLGPAIPMGPRGAGPVPGPAFGRDGVIDLEPDQYTVGPVPRSGTTAAGATAAGPTPRIAPR